MVVKKTKVEIIEAVGYIRQSDERQDKEDISEQTQLRKIEAFCDFNGFKLVKVFKDIDYSGFRIKYTKRPGLMEALEFVENRPTVKKFVFFNLSRLTRLRKDFHSIHERLKTLGVDICSASEAVDFSTANGRFVAGILVDMNEYYSDSLSDTMNETKRTNAEKGRWNGGPAPYGMLKKKDGYGFTEVFEVSYYIRKGFQMAKDGKGTYLISKWFNTQGFKTRTGKEWSPRRVRYMLQNPTYAAMQKWKDKYYPLLECPTFVSWDDFCYIQSTLFGESKVWKGKQRQLLSSILICPICGSRMHSRYFNTRNNRKYVCSRKIETGKCKSPNLDQASLNAAVISLLGRVAEEKFEPAHILPELAGTEDKSLNSVRKLQDELQNIERAEQQVFDDYYLHQKINEEQYNSIIRRYEKRKQEIHQLLDKIPLPVSKSYGDYDDVLKDFAEAIEFLEDDDKRRSVELLVEKIVPGEPTLVHFKWGEVKEIVPTETKKYKSKLIIY
ncbi:MULTISPECIES: recombinase family protein [Paenibacillus]|uniref:recombinase family protein n=1 Tax=Paenibacillus TaxID=44249 RepID=UPI0011AB1F52|nr:recombinase family protein [Paenibacillus sp. IHBB 10380]